MLVSWAEMVLVVADGFRDGNVGAHIELPGEHPAGAGSFAGDVPRAVLPRGPGLP
jgi:hypothetical protein